MLQDPSIADRDRVYFHLASDRLGHAYDGWGLTAGEWRRDEGRVARLLENLSRMLNSNENFQMDDTFHLSYVRVRAGPYGGGKKRKYLPGHQSSTRLKVMKRSVITIPQTDENLCCARALVTARAKAENHPKWRSFQRGRQLQLQAAIQLHETSGVRSGTVWRQRAAPVRPGPARIHAGDGGRQSGLRVFRFWSRCPIPGDLTRRRPLRCPDQPAGLLW